MSANPKETSVRTPKINPDSEIFEQKSFQDIQAQAQTSGQNNIIEERKRKITFVLPSLNSGGAERVLITLMNNLDRSKFEPEFIVTAGNGPMREWIASDIPVHIFNIEKISASYFKLLRTLKKIKPDVVFTTMAHSNATTLLLKPFFPKTKFIVRESSLPSALTKDYYGWKGKVCGYVYKFLYPYADVVLSPTMCIIDEFKNDLKISMKNHRILYNPVDLQTVFEHIPQTFEREKGSEKKLHFVCMGRLSFEKGFDRIVEAMPHLKSKYDWQLDILGDGPEKEALEALISKHSLENQVFLRGYQSSPWTWIAKADALILPSRWEGMPNVALESLACGTRVMAMREAGGIIEIDSMTARRALQTFSTINDLIEAMAGLKPLNKKSRSQSMLPEQFSLDHIMEEFQNFLAVK